MIRRTRGYGSRSTTRVNIVATTAVAVLTMIVSAFEEVEPRSFDGTGNNLASPEWGSVGSVQVTWQYKGLNLSRWISENVWTGTHVTGAYR